MTIRSPFTVSVLLLLLLSGSAGAEPVEHERVDLTAPTEDVDAQREQWRERFRKARDAVAEARQRNALAKYAYGNMRHRNRERGDEKAQVMAELTASELDLATSETRLKELFESARKAGVPPGWLRMDRSESPASPSSSSVELR